MSAHKRKKIFFTVPYIKKISDNFEAWNKKFKIHTAFTIPNTLKGFTAPVKIDWIECPIVIYKINCLGCDVVSQTKRYFKTRIQEHIGLT